MSKNKKIIAISIITIGIIGVSFLCGKTFSKYVTAIEGQGNAQIAKWCFAANGQNKEIKNIQLLKDTDEKLCPGKKGEFSILIEGTGSEVGIHYRISVQEEKNKPQNLIYFYEDKKYSSMKELEKELQGEILTSEEQKIKNITIYWEWPYETGKEESEKIKNDEIDTKELECAQQYYFNLCITGTQIMPK